MKFEPIGIFHSNKKNPYEAARQATADEGNSEGMIELASGKNFEQALIGLEQFSHIWILYQFDRNENWKPMVLPPRGTDHKVGVFATRAPYRPNPIGMSAVKLEKIEGLKVFISGHDILDLTPIMDIKPYLPYSDQIPEANSGWIQDDSFHITLNPIAQNQLNYLEQKGVGELRNFLNQQLSFAPTDERRKRVQRLDSSHYQIAYRTWRAHFHIDDRKIEIFEISSGYREADLQQSEDPYHDKQIHKEFLERFVKGK